MGRRKISIQPITDERNRKVTFVKRKAGLFKKAHELAVLCQVDLAVIILGKNHTKFYEYTSADVGELLEKFKSDDVAHDVKTPGDYGDYQLISRVGVINPGHERSNSTMSADVEVDESESEEEEEERTVKKRQTRGVKKETQTPQISQPQLQQPQRNQQPRPQSLSHPQVQSLSHPQVQSQHAQSHPPAHHQHPDAHRGLPQPPIYESYQQFTESQQRMLPPAWPETVPPTAQFQYQFPLGAPFGQQPVERQSQAPSSPYTRARSLNNNISKRPVLRVEIPRERERDTRDREHAEANSTVGGEPEPRDNREKTPTESGGDPRGLGILSASSTPGSASMPAGMFALPPPQPGPPKMGEQTPLTGGLPSRYVPDLFPSPSNFYSNDWNIPFGSGNTPFPTSANHQLPPRVRKLAQDASDSPLQSQTRKKKEE